MYQEDTTRQLVELCSKGKSHVGNAELRELRARCSGGTLGRLESCYSLRAP